MRLELRMKYLETIHQRYRQASKRSKGKILDELCHVCGYNRKYAIWKLSQMPLVNKSKAPVKRHRSKAYGHQVCKIVEEVWEWANYPWSLRLKEIVRLWLPWIKERFQITPQMEEKLLSISPSTIDRHQTVISGTRREGSSAASTVVPSRAHC